MAKIAIAAAGVGLLAAAIGVGWWQYQEKNSPEVLHKKVVLNWLNDPDSAKFRGHFQSVRDREVWCGEVNARNKMGGMVGFTRYVVYLNEPEDPADSFNEVHIDSPDAVSDAGKDAANAFAGRWSSFCEP